MSKTPNKIKQMVKDREDAYDEASAKIISELPNVTAGITSFFRSRDEIRGDVNCIIWNGVSIHEIADEEMLIVISGKIKYNIGEEVELESGDNVVIDVDNQDYFSKVIRVGVPIDIIGGSVEEICSFMEQSVEQDEDFDLSELESMLQNENHIMFDNEFDTSELTPEQQLALSMVTTKSEAKN